MISVTQVTLEKVSLPLLSILLLCNTLPHVPKDFIKKNIGKE